MTSTFKLTSAEFKKIFKRPSIFIMAILLVITLLVSIGIFHPTSAVDSTIIYDEAETSLDYYNSFYLDTNINSKKSFDDSFEVTDNIIAYYKALNNNTNLLTDYYNDAITTLDKMVNENNSDIRNQHRNQAVIDLKNFYTAYTTLDNLKNFPEITSTTLTNLEYKGGDGVSKNYYSSTACASLNELYNKVNDNNYTTNSIVDIYLNNDYKNNLKIVLNNGIDFVYTTIKGFVKEFNGFYTSYNSLRGEGTNVTHLKNYRHNMLLITNTLDKYLETLVDYHHPIIIIEEETYDIINQLLDETKVALEVSATQDDKWTTHEGIQNKLKELNVNNKLVNIIPIDNSSNSNKHISQVHMTQTWVADAEKISTKVGVNRELILAQIDSLKADESISNISKEITNYSLLEKVYNKLIVDKSLLSITENNDASEYTDLYGFDFENFNKYEYRERISTNKYYIDNNIYSNSFITNFSYAQNSGNKTNVYDFMYFTLELCTIIIIVFAMMLICNLITGETESGTIKLLLVRPYKRSKIITAKLLATIFFVITFMCFTTIVSFIGGYFLFGSTSTPVLAVLNSNVVFKISPFALMLLNIISLTFDVIFFVFLALMISILCKNYAGSISCSLVILIVNYALNILFGGAFWYTLLPGMNLHMFKYFGNAFSSTIAGTSTISGVIQSLLITGIDTSMSMPYSIFIYGVYSLVFLAVSYSVFQKRDF